MNWQNHCFDNPTSPVCANREFSGKRTPPQQPATPAGVTRNPFTHPERDGNAVMTVVGDMDWQFAEPSADAFGGLHVSRLATSPLARSVIMALGAQRGVRDAEMQSVLERLSMVDEAGISVKDRRIVAALSGQVNEFLSLAAAGAKTAPLSRGLGLIGHDQAVDAAAQRVALKLAPSDWTQNAEAWQSGSDLWVVGSGDLLGAEAVSTGLQRFSLTVWAADTLTSEMVFEFNAPPAGDALRKWQAVLGAVEPEGTILRWRTAVNAEELRQSLDRIVASPLGQDLAQLVRAARYLPVRPPSAPKSARPVIYGLDDGPRTVGQTSH